MNIIKAISGIPKVIDNGVKIDFEEILIIYRDGEWKFSVKINDNPY